MRVLTLLLLVLVIAGCGGTQKREITVERFKKVTEGMSLAEVTKIMGPPADVAEEGQTAAGKRTSVYHWVGADGIEYRVWIEGDTVHSTLWQVRMQPK